MAREIAPATLAHLLDTDSALALIDVREHGEYNQAHIPIDLRRAASSRSACMAGLVPFRRRPGRAVRRQWPARGPGRPDAERMGYTRVAVLERRRQSLGQPREADGGHERPQQRTSARGWCSTTCRPSTRTSWRASAVATRSSSSTRAPQEYRRFCIPGPQRAPAASWPCAFTTSCEHPGATVVVNARAHAQHHRCARAAADGAAQS